MAGTGMKKAKACEVDFAKFDAQIDNIISRSKEVKRSVDRSIYVDEKTLNQVIAV